MFDDFELESANLSKSDFVQIQQNPKNRLNLKNSKKVLEKFQSDTIAFHQNSSVLPNTVLPEKMILDR